MMMNVKKNKNKKYPNYYLLIIIIINYYTRINKYILLRSIIIGYFF